MFSEMLFIDYVEVVRNEECVNKISGVLLAVDSIISNVVELESMSMRPSWANPGIIAGRVYDFK